MERLQKLIAQAGICSRRHAEELIINNRVKVNGVIVNSLGSKANITDKIEIDDKEIQLEKKVYYMLNKPAGTITTAHDTHNRPTVLDIFKDIDERIFPIGRLDFDTTGLLLLTNDGDLDMHLIHPRFEIEKTYVALVKPSLPKNVCEILKKGIYLEDGYVKANDCIMLSKDASTCTILVKIAVGRKHIVKRMIKYIGGEVLQLHRQAIAFLTLGNLKTGEYRELSEEEVNKLKSL